MYPIFVAALMAAFLTFAVTIGQPGGRAEPTAIGTADAVAGSLGIYHTAAQSWAVQHVGNAGYVSSASLSLPATWRSRSDIYSYQSGGYLATWYTGTVPAAAVVAALGDMEGNELGSGLSSGGSVLSRRGTYFPVPAAVPNGVPVKVTKLY